MTSLLPPLGTEPILSLKEQCQTVGFVSDLQNIACRIGKQSVLHPITRQHVQTYSTTVEVHEVVLFHVS